MEAKTFLSRLLDDYKHFDYDLDRFARLHNMNKDAARTLLDAARLAEKKPNRL